MFYDFYIFRYGFPFNYVPKFQSVRHANDRICLIQSPRQTHRSANFETLDINRMYTAAYSRIFDYYIDPIKMYCVYYYLHLFLDGIILIIIKNWSYKFALKYGVIKPMYIYCITPWVDLESHHSCCRTDHLRLCKNQCQRLRLH